MATFINIKLFSLMKQLMLMSDYGNQYHTISRKLNYYIIFNCMEKLSSIVFSTTLICFTFKIRSIFVNFDKTHIVNIG